MYYRDLMISVAADVAMVSGLKIFDKGLIYWNCIVRERKKLLDWTLF